MSGPVGATVGGSPVARGGWRVARHDVARAGIARFDVARMRQPGGVASWTMTRTSACLS